MYRLFLILCMLASVAFFVGCDNDCDGDSPGAVEETTDDAGTTDVNGDTIAGEDVTEETVDEAVSDAEEEAEADAEEEAEADAEEEAEEDTETEEG